MDEFLRAYAEAAKTAVVSSGRPVEDVAQAVLDYTLWLNLLFVGVTAGLVVVAVR